MRGFAGRAGKIGGVTAEKVIIELLRVTFELFTTAGLGFGLLLLFVIST